MYTSIHKLILLQYICKNWVSNLFLNELFTNNSELYIEKFQLVRIFILISQFHKTKIEYIYTYIFNKIQLKIY